MRVSILLTLVAWLTVSGASVRADMADGLAAFDAGDYATAFEEWRALARAGEAEAQVALAGVSISPARARAPTRPRRCAGTTWPPGKAMRSRNSTWAIS